MSMVRRFRQRIPGELPYVDSHPNSQGLDSNDKPCFHMEAGRATEERHLVLTSPPHTGQYRQKKKSQYLINEYNFKN